MTATRVRFKVDSRGMQALLASAAARGAVSAEAARLRASAGEGFTTVTGHGNRARAYVRPDTRRARLRQARDHVLERVLGGSL